MAEPARNCGGCWWYGRFIRRCCNSDSSWCGKRPGTMNLCKCWEPREEVQLEIQVETDAGAPKEPLRQQIDKEDV